MKKNIIIFVLLFLIIGEIIAKSVEIPLHVISFDKEDEYIRHIPSKLVEIYIVELNSNILTVKLGKEESFNFVLSLFDIENNVIFNYQNFIEASKVSLVLPQSVIEKSISLTITVNGITYGGYIN